MKKLLLSILAATLVALVGCDTTDTKTIQINLGGSRAAPADITTVHVAVFPSTTVYDGDSIMTSIGAPVSVGSAHVAEGALNSTVSLVVPAGIDLYILVIAPSVVNNGVNDVFYTGEAMYEKDSSENVVVLSMQQPENYTGDSTTMSLTFSPVAMPGASFSDGGFTMYLGNTDLDFQNLYPYFQLHLEESSDDVNYNVISVISGTSVIGIPDGPNIPGVSPVSGNLYRARLYMPAMGIYFYTWDTYGGGK